MATPNRKIVSAHAVIRWLERVDGLDVDKVRAEAMIVVGYRPSDDAALLAYMERYHRLDIPAIRRKIATDRVITLLKTGLEFIPTQNRKIWLRVKHGTIATVIAAEERHD